MKQIFTLAFFCLGLAGATAQQTCGTAVAAGPGTHAVTLDLGSQPPVLICANGQNNTLHRGAWFSYTTSELRTTTISTAASNTDTRVHIYTGTCDALQCITGDDDGGPGLTSLVSFTAQPGVTYMIAFDDNWNAQPFTFLLTEAPYIAPMFQPQQISLNGYLNCIVDINGDYLDDIVAPGNTSVSVLYQSSNGSGLTPGTIPAESTQFMPTWSMAAGDFDNNGYNDLLYGYGSGAVIMKANSNGTGFTKMESPAGKYIFSQRTNFVDINNDGHLDAFVCHDVEPNCYFLNNGAGGHTFFQCDMPGAFKLGTHPNGGNYGSIWIDFDNDGDQDLFIAKCRGGNSTAAIDELHRNNGDGTFTNIAQENGFADFHQSWSSAWADYDNDGDMDVLVGASSNAGGGHKLMRNNGDGTFTNITAGSGYDIFSGMDNEHVAHDFNNDGFVDVFGGGNAIMFNNGDMTFSPVSVPISHGPIGDLNNDGFLDVLSGSTIFYNNDNGNHWLKVHLQGVDSNRNGIGARVEIYATGGEWQKQIRDVRSGDGFRYMSSLNTHFGLGAIEAIDQVVIKWPSGTIDIIENPDIDEALMVVEGQTLGTHNVNTNQFTLFPNPAKDILQIGGDKVIVKANIYDMTGRIVKSGTVSDGKLSVQQLSKGTYIIILQDESGRHHISKFIKG